MLTYACHINKCHLNISYIFNCINQKLLIICMYESDILAHTPDSYD